MHVQEVDQRLREVEREHRRKRRGWRQAKARWTFEHERDAELVSSFLQMQGYGGRVARGPVARRAAAAVDSFSGGRETVRGWQAS